jgi:hypothetical protein
MATDSNGSGGKRRLIWSCAAITAVVLVGMAGLAWQAYKTFEEHFRTKVSSPSLAEISEIACLRLPAGAEVLNSHYVKRWDGHMLFATVEFPRSGVDKFVKSLPRTNERQTSRSDIFRIDIQNREHPVGSWWNPESARKYIAVDYSCGGQMGLTILIRLDDPKRAVIYVLHQTS